MECLVKKKKKKTLREFCHACRGFSPGTLGIVLNSGCVSRVWHKEEMQNKVKIRFCKVLTAISDGCFIPSEMKLHVLKRSLHEY